MKKRIILFIIFAIVAIAFFLCIKNKEIVFGNDIVYGDDIEAIQSEFPEIPGIKNCHYKVERIGGPYFPLGPTSYHLTAIIIINSEEMEKIANEYEGEKRDQFNEGEQIKIEIEHGLVEDTDINGETVWTFNQEFRMKVLGWRYVGEVYYSEEENAIYVDVENL